jgi:hypothetical protein
MKTPKESPLTVSFSLPEISVIRREVELRRDESGYLLLRYSGEPEILDFNPQAVSELLKVIPPMEYMLDEKGRRKHGEYNIPEIDPEMVLSFLERFGVVGISDLDFRNAVLKGQDPLSITRLTGISLEKAKKLCKGGRLNPDFLPRLMAIRKGDEIPYRKVEGILQELAKSVRLYLNLLHDPSFASGEPLLLHDKNRKRIVSAWNRYGGAFKDQEDPANPKFATHEEWAYTYGGKRNLSPLDFAEGSLSDFSQVMNRHLIPITKEAIFTQGVSEFNRQNTGLETSISAYLVNSFKTLRVRRECVECGSVFLPVRIKEENLYCGESCSKRVRNRNYRAKGKKKVSAPKAGSKATPKARREKK